MDKNVRLVFTAGGMGDALQEWQHRWAEKFLRLLLGNDLLSAGILFYTSGVKLACHGALVLESL